MDTVTDEKLPSRGWNQVAYPLATYMSRVFRTVSESTWGILLALLGDQICDFHTMTYYLKILDPESFIRQNVRKTALAGKTPFPETQQGNVAKYCRSTCIEAVFRCYRLAYILVILKLGRNVFGIFWFSQSG